MNSETEPPDPDGQQRDEQATEGLLRPVGPPEGGGTLHSEDALRVIFAGHTGWGLAPHVGDGS